MYKPLTKRQKEILEFIKIYSKSNNTSPSLEEIRKHFKLNSVSTVHQHIEQLHKKGYIDKGINQTRSIRIVNPKLGKNHFAEIQILGQISNGKPITFFKKPHSILVNKDLVQENGQYFALLIHGNSMIDEGFFDKDILIIKDQNTARNRDLVIAIVQNKIPTIKRYYKEKKRIRLQPINPKASPRFYRQVEIKGKVVSLIRIFDTNHPWKKL